MQTNKYSGNQASILDGCLFPLEEFLDTSALKYDNQRQESNSHRYRKRHCNNLDLCLSMNKSGAFEIPQLDPYTGPIPNSLIPFPAAMAAKEYTCGVHFYIDDYQFERIWNSPEKYVNKLSKYQCVIGPDFSQYSNMSYPMRMWNCYRNRVMSSFLQKHGVNVIPNVTWSLPDSYDYSFDGIPHNSVIAINCSSIVHCNLSKYLWYKGYEEAIKRLQPAYIIRYGNKMPDEREDISIYFENNRLKMLRYGR